MTDRRERGREEILSSIRTTELWNICVPMETVKYHTGKVRRNAIREVEVLTRRVCEWGV